MLHARAAPSRLPRVPHLLIVTDWQHPSQLERIPGRGRGAGGQGGGREREMESASALNRTVLCLQSARLQGRGKAGEQNSKEMTNRGPRVRVGTEEERGLLQAASAQAVLTALPPPTGTWGKPTSFTLWCAS